MDNRPWYKMKRFLIPMGTIAAVSIGGALSGPTEPVSVPSAPSVYVQEKTQPVKTEPQKTAPVKSIPSPYYNQPELSNSNYYTNVDGNKVHSPAYAPSQPSGASAQCADGTYSFSQNRRGTCSHHGGVSEWY